MIVQPAPRQIDGQPLMVVNPVTQDPITAPVDLDLVPTNQRLALLRLVNNGDLVEVTRAAAAVPKVSPRDADPKA